MNYLLYMDVGSIVCYPQFVLEGLSFANIFAISCMYGIVKSCRIDHFDQGVQYSSLSWSNQPTMVVEVLLKSSPNCKSCVCTEIFFLGVLTLFLIVFVGVC